jgi:aspartate racemase
LEIRFACVHVFSGKEKKMLGILGGMGPLATVDFLTKVIRNTPASCDQDHIETIVVSAAKTPDRTAALRGAGPDPYPAMLKALKQLERSGAEVIAMPCNTAHYWHSALQRETGVPLLHIVDAVLDGLDVSRHREMTMGILATTGTIEAEIYQQRFRQRGCSYLVPGTSSQARVMQAIRHVKSGSVEAAGQLLSEEARALMDRGASHIVMACTEIPIALADAEFDIADFLIDPTDDLAHASVLAAGGFGSAVRKAIGAAI